MIFPPFEHLLSILFHNISKFNGKVIGETTVWLSETTFRLFCLFIFLHEPNFYQKSSRLRGMSSRLRVYIYEEKIPFPRIRPVCVGVPIARVPIARAHLYEVIERSR